MIENSLSLKVPYDSNLRDDIRRKVDLFFSLNRRVPPVSYNELTELADNLISMHNWDNGYKAFIMVCAGNAIWRSVVDSIPYNRRMLLLPQCLKNSNMCRASQDELGLLCNECGNCNISGFLSEAEKLGYITIVAEGTTIASRLIEGGTVDAIIGVGCMEVLQKMFSAVRKYSVPAIGVPLLTCGCIDTTADAKWIKEEIHNLNPDSEFRLLNISNLREKTLSLFTREQIDSLLCLSKSETDQMVRDTLTAGGKRLRPLLTVLTYEAFSTVPDMEVLNHLAMSVECFHKASLIHDDIEDGDMFRYGKETIHARYGTPVAINLGDLLIGEGYRLIAECNLQPKLAVECLKVVSMGHKALSIGQGDELLARNSKEILPLSDNLTIFRNKTAAAFRVSLLLGAVASGADKKSISLLDHFSDLIGIAYQLKDDLEDFKATEGSDSFESPSVLLAILSENVSNIDMVVLTDSLNDDDFASLNNLVEKYKIREKVTEMIKDYLQMINTTLADLQNLELKLALHEIVGKTFSNYL